MVATATRFVSIGMLPPSIKMKPFAHAQASTQVVLHESTSYGYVNTEPYSLLSTRTYTLADIVDSPEVTDYIARAARLPVSKIAILGPQWVELTRDQQFPSGGQRERQITIEHDPYQITLAQETTEAGRAPDRAPGLL